MGGNNQYESALNNVGAVVEPYDTDRSFPVFGFGGIPRHLGLNSVNHCFAMNGNPGDLSRNCLSCSETWFYYMDPFNWADTLWNSTRFIITLIMIVIVLIILSLMIKCCLCLRKCGS